MLTFWSVAHESFWWAAIVTIGQMAGKCVVYLAAQRGLRSPQGRTAERLERWRAQLRASPLRSVSLVVFSSVIGVPPFYFVSIAAGTIGLPLGWFLAAGTAGRLVRFGALALLPRAVMGAL